MSMMIELLLLFRRVYRMETRVCAEGGEEENDQGSDRSRRTRGDSEGEEEFCFLLSRF